MKGISKTSAMTDSKISYEGEGVKKSAVKVRKKNVCVGCGKTGAEERFGGARKKRGVVPNRRQGVKTNALGAPRQTGAF